MGHPCCRAAVSGVRPIFGAVAALLVWAAAAGCFPEPPTSPGDSTGDTFSEPDTSGACRSVVDELPDRAVGSVRVATHNVRRLFDTTCDTGACEEGYEDVYTSVEYRDRLAASAEALADIGADVLVLQEIETERVLDDLRTRLAEEGRDYPAAAFGEVGRPGSLDVGVLARGTERGDPLRHRETTTLERPDGSETTFTREFLGVPLEIDGRRVLVFAAHFKSKVDDDPGRRLAEARAARSIVSDAASSRPETLVLLAGDLNDTPDSPPLRALTEGDGLVPAAHPSTSGSNWSYCFEGTREAIDHILFVPSCAGALLEGDSRRWGGDSCPGDSGLADSDHAALSSDFALF